jgi:prepilin-type processing-associated H-X9-DG protein
MMLHKLRIALAMTVLALAAVSATTPASAFPSLHSSTVNFVFSDGSVRFLP